MKRRNFIKTTAAGSAFILTSGAYAIGSPGIQNKNKFGFQSERKIPVAYNVDVVVVGGSTAGVAAAIEASRTGAKVFLLAQEPYLGEDISGTFRLWNNDKSILNTELGAAIWGGGLPSQLKVKHTLDTALIDNKIDFLYSCYATDILTDANGNPAGVVMANRSGRQAIIAKTIIDATPRALVAKMAGVKFGVYPSGKQTFKFTVVGNNIKNNTALSAKIQSEPICVHTPATKKEADGTIKKTEKKYNAIEYTLQVAMKDDSWNSFAKAEQIARDLTWDANQVDSADLLFQNPPDKLVGQKHWKAAKVNLDKIDLKVFQPKKTNNLFVLSGSANLSNKAAETLLDPGKLIRIGERIGNHAAIIASSAPEITTPSIKGDKKEHLINGDISELLDGLRPTLNIGNIDAKETAIPIFGEYDVVVLGGGTAGAPAGVGAAQKGAKTLVVDYMHGLGGMGTLGMIGRYYHGYRKGYTTLVDKGVKAIGKGNPRGDDKNIVEWVFDWKTEYYREEIRNAGGDIWFGVIGCGAYVENNRVKGIVVATPEGKGIVLAHTVVDSTGSADMAIAAGALYRYTDGNSVAVQGAGFPFKNPNDFYNNTDWTFTNDTDLLDVWRTMVVAKDKFEDQYDIGKIPQTRERRRMIGDFTVSVLDVYNGRTYPDTISVHLSSFDTHGFTEDPFFALKPPEHSGKDVLAYMPFRALLPKQLEGIVVTGLGASANRDAMPVLRMQPCLQNQGFAVGSGAAMAAANNQKIRYINIKKLQKELIEIGSMPQHVITDVDNYPPPYEKVQEAAKTVTNNLNGLEIVLWDREKGISALTDRFYLSQSEKDKIVYARILGMVGVSVGWKELTKAIDSYNDWDEGWNFRGMGQFGRSLSYLDSLIIAAGRTRKSEVLPSIFRLMKKLTPESHFSHFRAVAISLETIGNPKAAEPIFELIQMPGVRGHSIPDIETAKRIEPKSETDTSTRNNSLRELILGRALYRCGDYNGVGTEILNEYSKDLRGHYYRHANGVLEMGVKQKELKIEL